ncbi:MAG TPA: DUF6069 family protein, partial [Streptosporangiaceae bacterium]
VSRWLFGIPILSPRRDGAWGDASTGAYVLAAAAVAVVATAIMHLLLLGTPRPQTFFAWIIGLATVVAVVFPFSTTAAVSSKIATSIVDLVLGFAIGSLLSEVGVRAARRAAVLVSYETAYRPTYPPTYPPTRTPGDR